MEYRHKEFKDTKMDPETHRCAHRHMHTASHINVSITIFGYVGWHKISHQYKSHLSYQVCRQHTYLRTLCPIKSHSSLYILFLSLLEIRLNIIGLHAKNVMPSVPSVNIRYTCRLHKVSENIRCLWILLRVFIKPGYKQTL